MKAYIRRLYRIAVIRIKILANEIDYFAAMHYCAEVGRNRSTDEYWRDYKQTWMTRSLQLHKQLHELK